MFVVQYEDQSLYPQHPLKSHVGLEACLRTQCMGGEEKDPHSERAGQLTRLNQRALESRERLCTGMEGVQ